MLLLIILQSFLWSNEASIFDVRKTLPLQDGEKIHHDYYLSAGTKDGLKNGMLVTVTRKNPFKDTNLSKIEESLVVDIAVLKLIHVQQTFSVARLEKLIEGPVLEFGAVMIGDRADLGKARMPSSEDKPLTSTKTPEKKEDKKMAGMKKEKPVEAPVKPEPKAKEVIEKQESVRFSGEIPANPDL